MGFLVLFGIILLAFTYWDYHKDETDTVFLLEWWAWFDVSREEQPLLFKAIIYIQAAIGVGMIIAGIIL